MTTSEIRTPELHVLPLSLGHQLRAARDRAQIRQEDMADILGYTAASLSSWERDHRAPPFEVVVQWSRITDWPLEYFASAAEPGPGAKPKGRKGRTRRSVQSGRLLQSPSGESNPGPSHYE